MPADWQRYESGGWEGALSRDGLGRVEIAVDSNGSLLRQLEASEPSLQSIAQGQGRDLFRRLGSPGGYVIYVQKEIRWP